MKPIEVFHSYADAWNSYDVNRVVAAFTKDGIYCNPYTSPGIGGEALAEFMKATWTAFPDFRVEVLNAGEIEPGLVAHHWIVTGTNTGQGIDGSAPTGRSVSIKGASIIQVEGDKIASDHTYFDRAAFNEQLNPKASE
jgi:steroid delta-isomerase-like uncharacterized protein